MILNRQQKEKLVIDLLNQGFSYPQIAKQAHVSFSEIKRIELMVTGDDKRGQDEEEKEKKSKSIHCQAFELFLQGSSPVQVAIDLELETDRTMTFLYDFLRLQNLQKLMTIYRELEDDIYLLEYLYHDLKSEGLANKQDIFNIVQMEGKLKSLNCELYQAAEEIGRLNSAKFHLEQEVGELQKKGRPF
jgi:hypothetical protein